MGVISAVFVERIMKAGFAMEDASKSARLESDEIWSLNITSLVKTILHLSHGHDFRWKL